MAKAALGKNAYVALAQADGTLVQLSGRGNGLAGGTYDLSTASRTIPGEDIQRQSLDMKDLSVQLTVDMNTVSTPVLVGASGNERALVLGPDGNTSGKHRIAANMLIETISIGAPNDNAVTYQVTMNLANDLEEDTFA